MRLLGMAYWCITANVMVNDVGEQPWKLVLA